MLRQLPIFSVTTVAILLALPSLAEAEDAPRERPPAASRRIDFAEDVKPILDRRCTKCHANGKRKGGFNIDHIHTFLGGGDSGPAVVPGKSADSLLIELALSNDPDERMPVKGDPLSLEEVSILRAWIDQGMKWEKGFTFAKFRNAPVAPRKVVLPPGPETNPVDRLLSPYYRKQNVSPTAVAGDAVFARRVFLDALGLLPTADELETFQADERSDKRARLVADLLADRENYSEHWVSFWNDSLRNSYTRQYHGGGGKPITGWLKASLTENKPYDQFVRELINPVGGSDGFIKGIAWRGTVNASQVTEIQAAQNVAQVFLGLNIKCASCHDSFINDWTLKQTYAFAAIFAGGPLDIHRCNKPIGEKVAPAFLYPELGKIDLSVPPEKRIEQLAAIMTSPGNGRLARTMVNRLWAVFFGRGLVEPVDEMDNPAWNQDLLDWLAVDFAEHGYDLKHTMNLLLTSQAYQRLSVPLDPDADEFVFRGPEIRRMSAEQFLDGLDQIVFAAGGKPPEKTQDLPERFDRRTALYDSGVITGGAKKVDVDISSKDLLVLMVGKGKRGTSWDHANWVDPVLHGAGGRKVKLTDLPWLKASSGWGKVIKDKSVTGTPLRIEGTGYSSGLGTHAESVIAYDLSGRGFTRFTATVGADESATGDPKGWADVEFLVYGIGEGDAPVVARGTGGKRAGRRNLDHLMRTLGRPKRDVIVTRRESHSTTAQFIELSNGRSVADLVARGGKSWLDSGRKPKALVTDLFASALGRAPSDGELKFTLVVIGNPATSRGIEDLLWMLAMHPEFQLIH